MPYTIELSNFQTIKPSNTADFKAENRRFQLRQKALSFINPVDR